MKKDLKLFNQNGTPYEGLYFFEKGKYFSGIEYSAERNRLLTQQEVNPILVRSRIPVKGEGYVPTAHTPVLNDHHYIVLGFTRYFVQKISRPYGTITEVSTEEYHIGQFDYGSSSATGLYQGSSVYWYIMGTREEVKAKNMKAIAEVVKKYPKFVGLDLHVVDYLKFFKEF